MSDQLQPISDRGAGHSYSPEQYEAILRAVTPAATLPDDQEGCDSCGFETRSLTFYLEDSRLDFTEGSWLCAICYSTPAGNAYLHPSIHSGEETNILKTIAYAANAVIAAVTPNVVTVEREGVTVVVPSEEFRLREAMSRAVGLLSGEYRAHTITTVVGDLKAALDGD